MELYPVHGLLASLASTPLETIEAIGDGMISGGHGQKLVERQIGKTAGKQGQRAVIDRAWRIRPTLGQKSLFPDLGRREEETREK